MPLFDRARRVLALGLTLLFACAHGQNVNDGFDPNPDGPIAAMALQADGKILIGGNFSHVGGVSRTYLARLNADGSLDGTFNPVIVGNYINAIAVQGDGKIVIGGQLSQVGTTAILGLARLNTNGSTDTGFNPMAAGTVYSLVVQGDGKILVGGFFSQINGQPCQSIARLNVDGSTDSGFTPSNAHSWIVGAILQQPDGRILVGGYLHPNSPSVSVAMMRLLGNGATDPAFQPVIKNGANDASVDAMALQPDGRIVFSGNFTSVDGYAVKMLARVDSSGNADALFNSTNSHALDNTAVSIVLQPSGDILIGGNFLHVNTASRPHVARLTRDGVLGTYNPNTTAPVYAMLLQSDSELLIGGIFSQIGTTIRHYVGRIDVNGNIDVTLSLAADQGVAAFAAQPNGGLLVGGDFALIGTTTRKHLARILANGSVDASYNPAPDDRVDALAQLSDGSALVGGFFKHIGGTSQAYLAHLNANGSVDTSFAPIFDDAVEGILPQPDGKIIVFSTYFTHIFGAARAGIGRLNANGSLDALFNVPLDANSYIHGAALLPNGQILVGGTFSQVAGGHDIRDVARLNSDGSFDGTFAPVIGSTFFEPNIRTIVVEPDGKILIGGQFPSVDGQSSASLARLNADGTLNKSMTVLNMPDPSVPTVNALLETANGKILVGGHFAIGGAYPNLARLNHDGTLDAGFADLGVDGGVPGLLGLAIERDGKIALGGYFQHVGGIARNHLARLSVLEAVQQSLVVNGSTVTWLRSGAAAEVALPPTLFYSNDNNTYAPLGAMARISGGWQYSGLTPPVGQYYWLRTQAPTASGLDNGSQGAIQETHTFYLTDDIFMDGFGS